jgi:hypothetical protein
VPPPDETTLLIRERSIGHVPAAIVAVDDIGNHDAFVSVMADDIFRRACSIGAPAGGLGDDLRREDLREDRREDPDIAVPLTEEP